MLDLYVACGLFFLVGWFLTAWLVGWVLDRGQAHRRGVRPTTRVRRVNTSPNVVSVRPHLRRPGRAVPAPHAGTSPGPGGGFWNGERE